MANRPMAFILTAATLLTGLCARADAPSTHAAPPVKSAPDANQHPDNDILDTNLSQGVYETLAKEWGIRMASARFKRRICLLTLAVGTSSINRLFEKPAEDLSARLKTSADTLIRRLDAADGPFTALDHEAVSRAWAAFVDEMTLLVETRLGGGNFWTENKGGLKNMAPGFLLGTLEASEKKDSNRVASWTINMLFENGLSHLPSVRRNDCITEKGYVGARFAAALEAFLALGVSRIVMTDGVGVNFN